MGKPCIVWSSAAGGTGAAGGAGAIVPCEHLRTPDIPTIVLAPPIDYIKFFATPYFKKHEVAVFLGGDAREWSPPAEDLELQVVEYIPDAHPVKISKYRRQAKLAYFRQEIYATTRLLVIPAEYPDAGFHMMEALASGIPVVIGPSTVMRELAGDAGVQFDWATVQKLMTDSPAYEMLQRKVGQRSREIAGRGFQAVLPFLEQFSR